MHAELKQSVNIASFNHFSSPFSGSSAKKDQLSNRAVRLGRKPEAWSGDTALPRFTDITDITDDCAETGLTTREDWNITFPESPAMVMYCAISVFSVFSVFSVSVRGNSAPPEMLTDYPVDAVCYSGEARDRELKRRKRILLRTVCCGEHGSRKTRLGRRAQVFAARKSRVVVSALVFT